MWKERLMKISNISYSLDSNRNDTYTYTYIIFTFKKHYYDYAIFKYSKEKNHGHYYFDWKLYKSRNIINVFLLESIRWSFNHYLKGNIILLIGYKLYRCYNLCERDESQ